MEPLAFGPFLLDNARGRLTRAGAPVPLGQKALAILGVLAETPGRTVIKEVLLARAWPGAVVEEGNLTVQVAALRKALGAGDDGRDWILTVPRVGYRLAPPRPEAPPPSDVPRVAVLPFADLSGDPDRAWFVDGVVADIIAALGRFRSFSVVALNTSLAYKGRQVDVRQTAAELGVRYLLEGAVRRAGDRLRMTAQLVDGETGAQLWAETQDGALDEVFDFQDSITAAVATVAEPRIHAAEIRRSRRERPGSIATYDLYLRALAAILAETEAGNAEAYALAVEGLSHEPDDPGLLTLASWTLEHRIAMGWPPFGPDDRARCGAFAKAALARAGDDATLLARCGVSLIQGAREYDLGMALLRSAVETNPNNVNVLVQAGVGHLHCGDLEQAMALAHRADHLRAGDLGAHFPLCVMAHVAILQGRHEEAIDLAGRAFARNPNFDPTLWMLAAAHAHLGRMEDARRYAAMLQALVPAITVARIREGQPARDPARIEPILRGLALAGLPAG